MPGARREWMSRLALLGLAGCALANGGCLAAAAAGAAGGGAAAIYAYERGRLYREYPANLSDTTAAVRTSLRELEFPVVTEKSDGETFTFESKTADGARVHVFLEGLTSRVPAEGPLTRVTVRVGAFGDDAVSARILDQVSVHLVAPPPTAGVPAPVIRPPASRPPETSAPPLAGQAAGTTK